MSVTEAQKEIEALFGKVSAVRVLTNRYEAVEFTPAGPKEIVLPILKFTSDGLSGASAESKPRKSEEEALSDLVENLRPFSDKAAVMVWRQPPRVYCDRNILTDEDDYYAVCRLVWYSE